MLMPFWLESWPGACAAGPDWAAGALAEGGGPDEACVLGATEPLGPFLLSAPAFGVIGVAGCAFSDSPLFSEAGVAPALLRFWFDFLFAAA